MNLFEELLMIRVKHDSFQTFVRCGIIDSSNDIVSKMYNISIKIEYYLCKEDLGDVYKVFDLDKEFSVLEFDLYRYLKGEREVKVNEI